MSIKRIETTLVLFVLAFTLFAIPTGVTGHESVRERYPTHVMAQGNLTLAGDPGTFEIIDIQVNFTAMVPIQLAHGDYSALFSGKAHVTAQNIFFRGDLSINVNAEEHEFHVSFTVPNTFGIPVNDETEHEHNPEMESDELGACTYNHELGEEYEATGEFEITVGPVSVPLPIEKTWVKIKGLINSFDEQPAFGWLKAHAKLGEWAKVRAFWTTTNLALNLEDFNGNDDHSPISFTYSFYAAVLANATIVELNYSGSDFYISGLWNVYNISWTYHSEEDFTFTVESLAEDRAGEFSVTGGWREFTLDITDIGVASGQVVFLLYRSFVIPRGDVNDDYIVDVWDLVHIAKRYGTRPGKPDFDFDIDFDDDFEIGLGELTTIAANLGTEY